MLTTLLLALVAGFTLITLTNWRLGVPLAILIGLVQDPVRKMIPGTPAILVLATLPIWAAIWFGAIVQERGWARFRQTDPRRAQAMSLFILSLVPGTLVTFSYGLYAWPVAALGLFSYVAPLLTMAAGFMFARRIRDLERLLAYYGIMTAVALIGVFLEYANLMSGWSALGTRSLGGDPWIRFTSTGLVFRLISGFFRSPDIAAWHAAALVMIGLTMVFLRPGARKSWWLAAIGWGGACLMVTGRRKGIIMPFVWTAFVGAAFLRTQRLVMVVRLVIIAVVAGTAFYYASGEFGVSADYFGYAESTIGDAPHRLLEGTWSGVWGTFEQSGALGSGIGTATQGGQHLGIHVADTWQESGPTKLAVELGAPGLLGALVLAFFMAKSAATVLGRARSRDSGSLVLALLAFTAANVVCFTISHQIYGDLTVLDLTALLFGAALAAGQSPTANRSTPPAADSAPGLSRAGGPPRKVTR
jgi:hypothetical protein